MTCGVQKPLVHKTYLGVSSGSETETKMLVGCPSALTERLWPCSTKSLEPDTFKGFPLDMTQYKRMFASSRVR